MNFSDEELARLERAHPFPAPIVKRFHQQAIEASLTQGMAFVFSGAHRGFVVLDWQLRPAHANLEGRRALTDWGEDPRETRTRRKGRALVVPAELIETCQQLGSTLQGRIRQHPNTTARCHKEVSAPGNSGLLAAITAVCHAGLIPVLSYMIEFRLSTGADQEEPDRKKLLSSLTESERSVALAVADGLSNAAIARQLGKTMPSVKSLLHESYRKLRVTTRTELALLVRSASLRMT